MAQEHSRQVVVVASQKNVGVAIILTFLFGPLGMFYSTVTGALVMMVVSLVAVFVTLGVGLLLTWPVCIIWGAMAASEHNKKLLALGARAVAIFMAGAALSACSKSSPTEPASLETCPSSVVVTVGTGTAPTFTWTPSCKVFAVLVEDDSGGDQWYVTRQSAGIAPGIRYGVVPQGAVQDSSASSLQRGTAYVVILFGTAGDDFQLIARREFTPQ